MCVGNGGGKYEKCAWVSVRNVRGWECEKYT